jgi:hypothetical protein
MKKNEKGFVLVFVMAVTAALSIMTSAMYFYYENDLKSVSRNSVMQQVTLAAETGLQEGQRWVSDQLNSNTFSLTDIQNSFHIDDSNNACLNRHGFNDQNQDVYFARRIQENLGTDFAKFEAVSYEVFIQRHADVVRSIYFSEQGSKNGQGKDTTYIDRSFALVENFKDFPTDQFTIEMWIKNEQPTSTYNMHLFEWGREWDLVFKVQNDEWSPRLGEVVLDDQSDVGDPVKDEWVHVAWVWDGGDPDTEDTGNVKIYQNGVLSGTFNANIGARQKSNYTNPPEILPEGNFWPLAIGEGLHGFSPNNYLTGDVKIQSTPWLGNISEMRIWNVSRSATDISNNTRRRLTGSEPGLVSYYKFNEGTGSIAKDYNTSRNADDLNDATIYGLGTVGTLWETEIINYPVTSTDDTAPTINVPPGEDLVYYKILSCGNGPQGQIVPLELVVSAPVQKGDVGDGNFVLTPQDLNGLTGQEGTPLIVSLDNLVGDINVEGDIVIQETDITNTKFFAFKRSMEQCNNLTSFIEFNASEVYNEEDCAEWDGKLWMLEKDAGTTSGSEFVEAEWSEVLGSGCDGVQFKSTSGDESYGHYYKYFSTAPNVTSDLGYNRDSIDWWEAKRRAEQSTCGGMRGYLVSIETAAENEFIKDAVMCDSSAASGCTGVTPFHVAAGETRANYYGSRLDGSNDQHYLWLANSDWRVPLTMRSESGPNMGSSNTYVNWQSNEPNGGGGAEDYTDMEINRSGRTNGGWNDLHRIPNCYSNGLDCITGYVVEYGGYDSFKLEHDENEDGDKEDLKDLSEGTKTCVARATIEKDKYVSEEDYLKYDNTDDAILDGSPDVDLTAASVTPFDTDLTDDYPGWDVDNGVLTLFHVGKPLKWNPDTSYDDGSFTWFNNRVWKNISGRTITGGVGLKISETPTIYNPYVWQLYSGNEIDAPCGNLEFWQPAFESIKYINTLAIDPEVDNNPYNEATIVAADTDPDDYDIQDEATNEASLGERVIIFSLGPLHVQKHLDGYNHFYEFYKFPVRASGTQNLYNDNNRRMNESFTLSNQLHYFSKTGYLVTVTSEEENEIITEKAVGNGWLGGIAQDNDQNDNADLNECGGIRQRLKTGTSSNDVSGRYLATKDFQALRKLEDSNVWEWYKGGEDYSGTKSNPQYIRDLYEVYSDSQVKTISGITATDGDTPTIVTTSSSHGLKDDDIIRLTDIDTSDAGGDDIDGTTLNKYYRVVVLTNQTFELVDLDSRKYVDTSGISYTSNSAQLRELEGIRNEFYRTTSSITNVNNNPQNQANLEMFWKDPKVAYGNIQGEQSENNACSVWRWVTGPEQFIYNNRGLAFAPNRRHNDNPSASQNSDNKNWTRTAPSGQQIGEKFKDGMPFRYWGPGEPNNYQKREPGLHMLGTHFSSDEELRWNDLYNWNENDSNAYGIRGIIVEYGGLESDGDPITRIAAKRIINLFDRRVTKATVTISNGAQTGDKLTAPSDIDDFGLTVTGDDTSEITFTGAQTCKNYLNVIKGMTFEHTGATEGVRQISISIGNVKKPTGSDHYYKKVDSSNVTYQQADFQSSYSNLCGLQGYLANVTTTADLSAISTLGILNDSEAWINGTDVCQGGIYRSGFWRYSSGPWKDKEFWRLRINSSADINSVSACNETNVKSSQSSVRVGPFETTNWLAGHPAANNNDYLTYIQSVDGGRIKTKASVSSTDSSDINTYIIRYGGSVGDFTAADIDEVNDVNVLAGPLTAEISFFTDNSDNSIFIDGEDTLEVPVTGDGALSSGWSRTNAYSSQLDPLKITPPSTELITMDDWKRELAKVYYKNINLSNFTPGNRKIKIKLVYGDITLNQTIGIVKTIGSRNKVTVTPISWSNR